jgi:uncharacterized protein
MRIEHILVDGYSIMHQWTELKPARLQSLATGRQALIHLLTQFHDADGRALTVVFDGRSLPRGGEATRTSIQVVFSKDGQTADAVIERIIGQSPKPQSFLVATDDYAEQNVVEGFGAQTISAQGFHSMVQAEVSDLSQTLETLSLKNRNFGRRH